MSIITINELGCGSGKTYLDIYPRIQKNIQYNVPTLLVCISTKLQQQYKSQFPGMLVINTDTKDYDSCNSSLHQAMYNQELLICITQQTFIMFQYNSLMSNYHLIIDESLDNIIYQFDITKGKLSIPWQHIFHPVNKMDKEIFNISYQYDKTSDQEWIELEHNGCYENDDAVLSQSSIYRNLINNNYRFYASYLNYKKMIDGDKSFIFFGIIDTRIFSWYQSVHIAAAAFDKTYLYHLLKRDCIEFEITDKFQRHSANIVFNMAVVNDKRLIWSYKLQNSDKGKDIKRAYHNYIKSNVTGNILTLRNKSKHDMINGSGFTEYELAHNVHGQNKAEYMNSTNINIEAAILPSPAMDNFIRNVILDYIFDESEKSDIKDHLYYGYKYYQTIMRCKLRDQSYNNEKINLYFIDAHVSAILIEYFNPTNKDCISVFELGDFDLKKIPKPTTVDIKNMTPEQKREYNRQKQKERREKLKQKSVSNVDTE